MASYDRELIMAWCGSAISNGLADFLGDYVAIGSLLRSTAIRCGWALAWSPVASDRYAILYASMRSLVVITSLTDHYGNCFNYFI